MFGKISNFCNKYLACNKTRFLDTGTVLELEIETNLPFEGWGYEAYGRRRLLIRVIVS